MPFISSNLWKLVLQLIFLYLSLIACLELYLTIANQNPVKLEDHKQTLFRGFVIY